MRKSGESIYTLVSRLLRGLCVMPLFPFMEVEPGAQIIPFTFHEGSQVAECRDWDANFTLEPPLALGGREDKGRSLGHLSGQFLWSTEASKGCKRTKQTSGD